MNRKKIDWMKMVYHYTTFESAIHIIVSNSLKFGHFKNMNDISEVKRDIMCMKPESFKEEIDRYKAICLTSSTKDTMGFDIPPLWGHYAQKGNGVCLLFDREELLSQLNKQYPNHCTPGQPLINYVVNYSNATGPADINKEGDEPLNDGEILNIFYTKAIDWKYESEYRLLIRNDREDNVIDIGDALQSIIVCFPKEELIKNHVNYKILRKLLPSRLPIFHYTTQIGNRLLHDENGKKIWPIEGIDYELDLGE